MTDAARSEWVATAIQARKADYARQVKFCPACGNRLLGGVPGDLSLLGCTRCGQRTSKYLMDTTA